MYSDLKIVWLDYWIKIKFNIKYIEQINGTGVTIEEIIDMDKKGKLPRKLDRAVEKDTVTVPDGGYTIIRFHATNPGIHDLFELYSRSLVFHSLINN